jgi:hypothetical protein
MDVARIENTESLLHDLASSRGQYKLFVSVSRNKEDAQAFVDNIQYVSLRVAFFMRFSC